MFFHLMVLINPVQWLGVRGSYNKEFDQFIIDAIEKDIDIKIIDDYRTMDSDDLNRVIISGVTVNCGKDRQGDIYLDERRIPYHLKECRPSKATSMRLRRHIKRKMDESKMTFNDFLKQKMIEKLKNSDEEKTTYPF